MTNIPFLKRLSTRLTLLILLIVFVLAAAAAILLIRGFDLAQRDAATALAEVGVSTNSELPNIIRSTVINLVAVFLFTLVAAAVFSRSLLTEPIISLVEATQKVSAGEFGVTLPVTSTSELGLLASTFNDMSGSLANRTEELLKANEALRQSEARLEQRVVERTSEMQALLELSNSTALTLEFEPLLERILDKLADVLDYSAAHICELRIDDLGESVLHEILSRGESQCNHSPFAKQAVTSKELVVSTDGGTSQLHIPLIVRDKLVGVMGLEHGSLDYFHDDRVRLASAFANQVAVAFENSKLYEQVQEKAAYDERQHLARELHDSVSQALYGIVLGSHTARKQLDLDPQKAVEPIEYVQNLAEAGIVEMRALIFELRPELLEKEGLVGTLRKQVEVLETRHHLTTDFFTNGEPVIAFSSKQALYRVAQEALHNVVKHAKAKHVSVTLMHREQENQVQLEIVDNGIGFETADDIPGHLGLKSMRERIHDLGGNFTLQSALGQGTSILIRIPLDALDDVQEAVA